MKKLLMVLSLTLILVFVISACGGAATTATPSVTETPPAEPVNITLSFPDGAPPLNQSAVFKCTVANALSVEKTVSIEITYPARAYKLEGGELTWSGTVPANGEITAIEASLMSDNTGHYEIKANCHIDPAPDGYGGDFIKIIYVNSGMSASEWGVSPPWQK